MEREFREAIGVFPVILSRFPCYYGTIPCYFLQGKSPKIRMNAALLDDAARILATIIRSSLYFSLLWGNSCHKTGSTATASATTQSCLSRDFLTAAENAANWRIHYPRCCLHRDYRRAGRRFWSVSSLGLGIPFPGKTETGWFRDRFEWGKRVGGSDS